MISAASLPSTCCLSTQPLINCKAGWVPLMVTTSRYTFLYNADCIYNPHFQALMFCQRHKINIYCMGILRTLCLINRLLTQREPEYLTERLVSRGEVSLRLPASFSRSEAGNRKKDVCLLKPEVVQRHLNSTKFMKIDSFMNSTKIDLIIYFFLLSITIQI